MDLQETRKRIDAMDKELVGQFEERLLAVIDVITYKMQENLPVYDSRREDEVVAKCLQYVKHPELKTYISSYVKAIMDISKEYQHDYKEQQESVVSPKNK
ncbi:MAG: chorismate mutase [Veillonellaceae bacterium]|nr:chorismate mutase [Veillonellaceae bacterium]